jgi:hypothetical protein
MADSSVPVPSLSRAREEKISELSTHFANDDLSLEDLERRIELVYKAASVAELEEITADLRRAVTSNAPVPVGKSSRMKVSGTKYELASARLLSLMSSTRRVGRWAVPQKLDVVAIMSDTKIDFTHAAMPGGIVNVHLRAIMASCKLVVPPNVRVVNETHSVMSTVRSRADELLPDDASATGSSPVIRLTGVAFMSDVRIVVRRREEPVYDDEDDDDDDD